MPPTYVLVGLGIKFFISKRLVALHSESDGDGSLYNWIVCCHEFVTFGQIFLISCSFFARLLPLWSEFGLLKCIFLFLLVEYCHFFVLWNRSMLWIIFLSDPLNPDHTYHIREGGGRVLKSGTCGLSYPLADFRTKLTQYPKVPTPLSCENALSKIQSSAKFLV